MCQDVDKTVDDAIAALGAVADIGLEAWMALKQRIESEVDSEEIKLWVEVRI